MNVEFIISAIIGVCAGGFAAAGLFAFITTLNIMMRLAHVTHTADHIHWYENGVILGAVLGTVCYCYPFILPIGALGTAVFGVFAGIFTGCLVGAVAEILNAFPVFFRRMRLHQGVMWVVAALAFGKFVGVLIQYFGAL